MKDFAQLINQPYAGQQKTHQEIRDTTQAKIPKPTDYQYGQKLSEWDASLSVGQEHLLLRCHPMHDRILVKLLPGMRQSALILTDPQPLIGGCRKAMVLKTGPGRWVADDDGCWLRPMTVKPGDTVLIGNWVDLEVEDIALCQEADVRGIVA